MLQVVNTIFAALSFVITPLFHFVTDSVPNPLDTLQAFVKELSDPEQFQDPGETEITKAPVQQVVITAICATDLTLGFRRIPAAFHVVVKTDVAEFQTSNKCVLVDQAVVEWNETILLPCEPSSMVRISVYASFEVGPMLCHGDVLHTFEISVRELLGRSEKSLPIIFSPKQEEVVSACTSLLMKLEQRLFDEKDVAGLCSPNNLIFCDMGALTLETDAGHRSLAHHCRTQNDGDLEQSINHFKNALSLCPIDHPCRPAALFNLATALFVRCQVDGRYFDLHIPISLFQDALDLRPTGHPDRSVTQLHLAIALLSCFTKRGLKMDVDAAEDLLREVLNVCHADSHIYRAALLTIKISSLHLNGIAAANALGHERPPASMHLLSPNQLADRAERCLRIDNPHALDEAIALHYDALRYYNIIHAHRGQLLCSLGSMLYTRYERQGNGEDLDCAIALQDEALTLYPVGFTDESSSLNNLTAQLSTRFDYYE